MAAMGSFVDFYKGRFDAEYDEIEQNGAREFVGDDPIEVKESMRYLRDLFDKASPEILPDTIWMRLGNTGSWNVKTFEDLFRNLQRDGVRRDVTNIVRQYFNGPREGAIDRPRGKVECPILLYTPENAGPKYHLMGGNTRLTIARVLGITPRVIILRTDW